MGSFQISSPSSSLGGEDHLITLRLCDTFCVEFLILGRDQALNPHALARQPEHSFVR